MDFSVVVVVVDFLVVDDVFETVGCSVVVGLEFLRIVIIEKCTHSYGEGVVIVVRSVVVEVTDGRVANVEGDDDLVGGPGGYTIEALTAPNEIG